MASKMFSGITFNVKLSGQNKYKYAKNKFPGATFWVWLWRVETSTLCQSTTRERSKNYTEGLETNKSSIMEIFPLKS